jgi:hypothetical protein
MSELISNKDYYGLLLDKNINKKEVDHNLKTLGYTICFYKDSIEIKDYKIKRIVEELIINIKENLK